MHTHHTRQNTLSNADFISTNTTCPSLLSSHALTLNIPSLTLLPLINPICLSLIFTPSLNLFPITLATTFATTDINDTGLQLSNLSLSPFFFHSITTLANSHFSAISSFSHTTCTNFHNALLIATPPFTNIHPYIPSSPGALFSAPFSFISLSACSTFPSVGILSHPV
eukprot:Pompholyxophrys_punicea_v1_NODE_494_length_1844_cov_14.574064.p2 type:complete len:168 gc:universal NODE_494_length_1844_cov_14.574064:748-245(-)